ncbi:MAG: Lon protease, partial [Candidatus Gottesmanbacteria bacterium GW2011_GWC2_39_8]
IFPSLIASSKISIVSWALPRPNSGIRTLERTINGVCRKIAKEIVEGKGTSFHLTPANIKEYLPKW